MEVEIKIKNWDRLKYRVPLHLEGFNPLYSEGTPIDPSSHVQLQMTDASFQENYDIFKNKVTIAIGKKYLPIYRMADGEFNFINYLEKKDLSRKEYVKYILKNIKLLFARQRMYNRYIPLNRHEILRNLFDPYLFKVAHNEIYTSSERIMLKKLYTSKLLSLSKKGIVALHFIDCKEIRHQYAQNLMDVADWFDKNGIILDDQNLTSFYYIYALLTGVDKMQLLKNRNVLIITSFDDIKKNGITNFLINEQCRTIQFYKIPFNKSMFIKIDISLIKMPVDLVLIGAGIGTVNILTQLEKLQTVCIDAGIVLERYADPRLARSRIFIS